jgi:hypothetical protein
MAPSTCQPTSRDGGALCTPLGGACTTSTNCCVGCCGTNATCTTLGPCVIAAPLQCQTAGAFCNPEAPTRRCCAPPLTPALACLEPANQACATGFDCCSGCCQGRPGPGACAAVSQPEGTCQ